MILSEVYFFNLIFDLRTSIFFSWCKKYHLDDKKVCPKNHTESKILHLFFESRKKYGSQNKNFEEKKD